MKMIKKFSCLILILAMTCSLMPMKNVSAAKTKRYTVILLDAGRGVEYTKGDNIVYESSGILEASKEAAKYFVENLYNKESKYDDYITVMYYNDTESYIKVMNSSADEGDYAGRYFSNKKNTIVKQINGISECPKNGENMAAGLSHAKNKLSKINSNNKNVLVINTGYNCHKDSLENDADTEYRANGHYTEDVVGSSWRYGSDDMEYEDKIPCYYYSNVAYDCATELKKIANVFSIGMFNIYSDAPDNVNAIIALQKLLAKDIATNDNFYFEVEDMENSDKIYDMMNRVSEAYSKEVYNVKAESNNESYGTVTGGRKYFAGDEVTLNAYPKADCSFEGWYYNGKKLKNTDTTLKFKVKKSVEIIGKFIRGPYDINIKSDDELQGTVTGGRVVNDGEEITLEAHPNENYHFVGWEDDRGWVISEDNPYTFTPDMSMNLVAIFEHNPIKTNISVNNPDFGTATCNPKEPNIGDKITCKAKPEIGYKFDGWYDENGHLISKDNPYKGIADKDSINIIAYFSWDRDKSANDTVDEIDRSNLKLIFLEGHSYKGKIKLKWNKAGEAVRYKLFKSECDGLQNYDEIADTNKTSYVVGNLNNKKAYKFYVVAYKKINGNIKYTRKTFTTHVALSKYKQTNVKKVVTKRSNIEIKIGRKLKIKTSITSENSKKKIIDHVPKYRYEISNKSIAGITKKGVIKGKKKGSCKLYIVAHNGVKKIINVKVK